MKNILIISATRELQNGEAEELKKNMLTKPSNTRAGTDLLVPAVK